MAGFTRRALGGKLGWASLASGLGLAPNPAQANPPPMPVVAYAGAPMAVTEASFFAFDDYSIPFRHNLYLTMHAAEKHPDNPVLRQGPPGAPDDYGAQFYGSIIKDHGKLRMWYLAFDRECIASLSRKTYSGFRAAYAESDDGAHWTRPNLGLVDYGGSRNNNLVQLDPPDLRVVNLAVLDEPDDPDPAHRYKMMVTARAENVMTSFPFFSADGLRWRQAVPARIQESVIPAEAAPLPQEFFEQSGFYRWQGMYYLTGQQLSPWVWLPDGKPCGRAMSIFRSRDLRHWPVSKTLGFVRWGYSSAPTSKGEEAHIPAAVWNRGNVLLGLFGLFHGSAERPDHPIDLGLLISNDGVHFREPLANFIVIPRGWDKALSWESGAVVQGQGFENMNGRTHIWYSGWDADVTIEDTHAAIGLATLRQDSFGSLSPKNPGEPAELVTSVVQLNAPVRLWINAEGLSQDAWLKVELLRPTEEPIQAYSEDSALPLYNSGPRVKVSWKDREQVTVPDSAFRIRVIFGGDRRQSIKFYALYVG